MVLSSSEHEEPLQGALMGSFLFVYGSPKRKRSILCKVSKPDLTNLVKLVEDAMLPYSYHGSVVWQGTYGDDSQIIWEQTAKMYCWAPEVCRGVYVLLREMDDGDMHTLITWAEQLIRRVCDN
jgi:Holliday junction resolvase RusA-like endonuclease